MRTILLAAGFGARLRPLTDTIPKCLVPIKGKPLLEIWLEKLQSAGFGPFLVNTHYLSEKVSEFISSGPFKESVTVINEKTLLGTAGTLIANIDFFNGEDGMLLHADNYCLADLSEFRKAHNNRPPGCLMTMMTFRTDNPSACGIVEVDRNGVVMAFHKKIASPPGNIANGAIYILSGEMLTFLKTNMDHVSDFSKEVLNKFVGRIFTYHSEDFFLDIGTPEAYEKANL